MNLLILITKIIIIVRKLKIFVIYFKCSKIEYQLCNKCQRKNKSEVNIYIYTNVYIYIYIIKTIRMDRETHSRHPV